MIFQLQIQNPTVHWLKFVKSSGDISPISQLKKENNDLISDDYEIACLLNNYFCFISTLFKWQ